MTDVSPKVMLYKGRPLEEYSREELIEIARQGWQAYHDQLEDSMRNNRFWADLHRDRCRAPPWL